MGQNGAMTPRGARHAPLVGIVVMAVLAGGCDGGPDATEIKFNFLSYCV